MNTSVRELWQELKKPFTAYKEPSVVPHWHAIRNPIDGYFVSDEIFPDIESAKSVYGDVIRLAIEWAPLMLEPR